MITAWLVSSVSRVFLVLYIENALSADLLTFRGVDTDSVSHKHMKRLAMLIDGIERLRRESGLIDKVHAGLSKALKTPALL